MKTGPWYLKDLESVKKNGLKVFSCFHCGGGSSMGYKLSGYEVLGGVEIDPKMMEVYRRNHNPKHSFLMGVKDFNEIPNDKLPKELFELDILDGSPPCSSFSMAGSREKDWGKKKKFREGQAEQILDDLFFNFIDTAQKLKPKVVVAENVKGMIMGNARHYIKQVHKYFDLAGYNVQLFLLNAAFMGVPQRRERVFFICTRKDLNLPKIDLNFNEEIISIEKAMNGESAVGRMVSENTKGLALWKKCKRGANFSTVHENGSAFNMMRLNEKNPSLTITGSSRGTLYHWNTPSFLNDLFYIRMQTFPEDYDFTGFDAGYITGMSVPPYMMNRVSKEIEKQLLKDFKKPVLIKK